MPPSVVARREEEAKRKSRRERKELDEHRRREKAAGAKQAGGDHVGSVVAAGHNAEKSPNGTDAAADRKKKKKTQSSGGQGGGKKKEQKVLDEEGEEEERRRIKAVREANSLKKKNELEEKRAKRNAGKTSKRTRQNVSKHVGIYAVRFGCLCEEGGTRYFAHEPMPDIHALRVLLDVLTTVICLLGTSDYTVASSGSSVFVRSKRRDLQPVG